VGATRVYSNNQSTHTTMTHYCQVLLLALLGVSLIAAQNETATATACTASVTFHARSGGSWVQDGVDFQIFDIIATNNGDCVITSLSAPMSGLSPITSQSWNYDVSSGAFSNFGGQLLPSQTFGGAGIVVNNAKTVLQGTVDVTATCSNSCVVATPGKCEQGVSIEVGARQTAQGSWVQDGVNYQIYDMSVFNNGPNTISAVFVSIATSGGNIDPTNNWNIHQQSNSTVYSFDLFGNTLPPKSSYIQTSGFVLVGNGASASVQLSSATC